MRWGREVGCEVRVRGAVEVGGEVRVMKAWSDVGGWVGREGGVGGGWWPSPLCQRSPVCFRQCLCLRFALGGGGLMRGEGGEGGEGVRGGGVEVKGGGG